MEFKFIKVFDKNAQKIGSTKIISKLKLCKNIGKNANFTYIRLKQILPILD
jgi:hypothetical protein